MKKYLQKNRKSGFTLMEVLVAVLIVVVLVTMAVPMYERVVEKSRRAEVSVTLKRLSESKLRIMDSMEINTFSKSPVSFTHTRLDGSFSNNSDFNYSLYPSSTYPNAVYAKRARGDYSGTIFMYLGEAASDYCTCPQTGNSVCGLYCSEGQRLFCKDDSSHAGGCNAYGMDSISGIACDTSVF